VFLSAKNAPPPPPPPAPPAAPTKVDGAVTQSRRNQKRRAKLQGGMAGTQKTSGQGVLKNAYTTKPTVLGQ